MRKESADCLWEPLTQSENAPCDRFKHACSVYDGYVYIHGGHNNYSLRDFWRYTISCNEWEELPCTEHAPEKLEAHSMVAYGGVLYVFGGLIDSGANEEYTPLWMYDIDSEIWCENKAAEGEETRPCNRKGHTAAIYQSAMYIYGGYFDIKGAVEEFWAFSFDTGKWSALSPSTRDMGPGPRHGHSAVTYNAAMYLFGGLKHMAEQSDFWKFDFRRHHWSNIRTSSGPPKVVGHASLIHRDCLWILGGGLPSRNPTNNLWRFHFNSRSWKRITSGKECSHYAKMYQCVIGVGGGFEQGSRLSHRALYQDVAHRERGAGTGKHSSLRTWGTNRMANIPTAEEMEMKTLKQFPATPVFCSCSFFKSEQTEEQHLLSHREEGEFTCTAPMHKKEGDSAQEDPVNGRIDESQDVVLILGGKLLSRSCRISVWQLKLGQI
ncbi:hypothetical protein FKM82_015366 [Ascaphus truei]